ncbi:hypothetical protein J27TS8_07260 [Robertmurraya siralis]|uniref:Uncharacterized protein n=1 Tax=Robertmurraya siralis TaxID=77777 RepID=A0A919WEY7_9BACI|nr:hypothetical protein J27TS8_07260 [Robertmurraya siralis]
MLIVLYDEAIFLTKHKNSRCPVQEFPPSLLKKVESLWSESASNTTDFFVEILFLSRFFAIYFDK